MIIILGLKLAGGKEGMPKGRLRQSSISFPSPSFLLPFISSTLKISIYSQTTDGGR